MKKKILTIVVITISSLLALGLVVGSAFVLLNKASLKQTSIVNRQEKEVTITDEGIADAVDKLYDAVVVVTSYKDNSAVSSGTGFVYKSDNGKAYILTNSHVISGSKTIKVKFTNGKTEDVEVVGDDVYSDIAVLSINAKKIIKIAEIGSSEKARLGDTLFTIGAPLDTEYSWTVTRGILSGKNRLVEVNASSSETGNLVMSVMQTDAAINSGNSGGPIANSNGEVIGITNMKLVSGGVEGMGFAIPIEDALLIAEELIKNKEIIRPILGVGTINATETNTLRQQYGISLDPSITSGAVVGFVQVGTPADKSKLEKGDVIVKFGDYDITSSAKLKYYLYKYNIGDKVEISYIRGKKTEKTTVTLNERAN